LGRNGEKFSELTQRGRVGTPVKEDTEDAGYFHPTTLLFFEHGLYPVQAVVRHDLGQKKLGAK